MDQLLHIYAQEFWHSPAEIMGSREALKALRDVIDTALLTGQESHSKAMAVDGEGYSVIINIRDEKALNARPLPYYSPLASRRPE